MTMQGIPAVSARSINALMDDFFALCGMIRDEADDEGMLDPAEPLDEAEDMRRHKILQMASYDRFISAISHALRQESLERFDMELLKSRRLIDIIVSAEEAAGYASPAQIHRISRRMEALGRYAREVRAMVEMGRPHCAQRAVARKSDELLAYWLWLPI